MRAAVRELGYSRAQDIHLGLNPTFSPGLHADGKPDKMIFCRKKSLLILPLLIHSLVPSQLSVAHVAEQGPDRGFC
ncbi:hypothetical protein CgunFtcFv8_013163 [Champsocephalus gunnari]|uniref:Uncharacterized protein n=1 Tax=Champsocephalus gunnari TaxID=52237 RepID=A0AAN8HTS6_CHAGU|nr:hypothetical protein CgunFtcFv8_013163 [Champsocephalus gunnari]